MLHVLISIYCAFAIVNFANCGEQVDFPKHVVLLNHVQISFGVGVVITKKYVLTACTNLADIDEDVTTYEVQPYDFMSSITKVKVGISKFVVHPMCSFDNTFQFCMYNLGIVISYTMGNFSPQDFNQVPFWNSKNGRVIVKKCNVFSYSQQYKSLFQEIAKIINCSNVDKFASCIEEKCDYTYIRKNMVCFQVTKHNKWNSIKAGSPIICDGLLYGIVGESNLKKQVIATLVENNLQSLLGVADNFKMESFIIKNKSAYCPFNNINCMILLIILIISIGFD